MEDTVILERQEFPRSPIRSQPPASRKLPSTQVSKRPAPKTAVFVTETIPSTSYENYGTDGESFEFKSKEKEVYKDEVKVSVKDDHSKHHYQDHHQDDRKPHKEQHHHKKDDCKPHHKKDEKKSGCSGTTFAIILFVIFIIILFVALGGFWYCQPECVTSDTESGGREFSLVSAALYAFVIALFFIIIIGAAWYCCF
jgi:hypothetical protein